MFAAGIMSGDIPGGTPAPPTPPAAPIAPAPPPAPDPVAPPPEIPPGGEKKPEPPAPTKDDKPVVPAKDGLELPEKKGAEPKKETEPADLEEEDETEEQFSAKIEKLSKTEVNKLARKAFKQRGDAFRLVKSLKAKAEAHDALLTEKTDLEKKIQNLTDAPETKAQQAALAKKEEELNKLNAEITGSKEKIEKDRSYLEGLRLAHDVTKTEKYKEYVDQPSEELMKDIDMVSTTVGDDDAEAAADIKSALLAALKIGDENERWRQLKIAGKDLSPADQSRLADIYKAHQRIARNHAILTGQSEEARKAIVETHEKETLATKAAKRKEYEDGITMSRDTFKKDFPWVDETFDLSKFPESFQEIIGKTRAFAAKIDMDQMTPGQLAKIGQGYAYFQGASILAREYASELEKELKSAHSELATFRGEKEAKEKAEADAAAKAAEDKGKLTPSAAPKKTTQPITPPNSTRAVTAPVQTVGTTFASMVARGT